MPSFLRFEMDVINLDQVISMEIRNAGNIYIATTQMDPETGSNRIYKVAQGTGTNTKLRELFFDLTVEEAMWPVKIFEPDPAICQTPEFLRIDGHNDFVEED